MAPRIFKSTIAYWKENALLALLALAVTVLIMGRLGPSLRSSTCDIPPPEYGYPAVEAVPADFLIEPLAPEVVNMDEIRQRLKYPAALREAGIEGKVIVRVLVNSSSRVEAHEIIRSPHPLLSKAVEDVIYDLEFQSFESKDLDLSTWYVIPFSFNLK